MKKRISQILRVKGKEETLTMAQTKKILQLIGALSTGGAETLVKDYAIHFGQDIDCTVAVLNKSKQPSANELQLKEHGVKVVNLADFVPFQTHLLGRVWGKYKRAQVLKRYLKQEGIEVVHAHLPVNIYVYLATRGLKNIKLFYTVHNEPKRMFGKPNELDAFFARKLVKTRGMRLIGLHQDMVAELNEMFGVDNSVVVNNGIHLERFNKALYAPKRQEILDGLHLQSDDFIIGHVGRFTQQKNHAFLLDVFVNILQVKPNAKLLLIGSGELKTQVMAKVEAMHLSEQVVMLENRRDIPELMSVMDVFLFPSLWEGLSVTLVEAQAMGLKCVVSQNVNSATHLTDRFIPLSLEQPVATWTDAVVNVAPPSEPVGRLQDFDMKDVVAKLEGLYR